MSRPAFDEAKMRQFKEGEAAWQSWFATQISPFLSVNHTDPSYTSLRLQYLKAFVANILHNIQMLQNTTLPAGIRLPTLMNARSHVDTLTMQLVHNSSDIDAVHSKKAQTLLTSLYSKFCHEGIDDAVLDDDKIKQESDEAVEALSMLSICKK